MTDPTTVVELKLLQQEAGTVDISSFHFTRITISVSTLYVQSKSPSALILYSTTVYFSQRLPIRKG
jgi:hypothetical protein